MPDPTIPLREEEIDFSAIRAQGAGGQNVNKVSSAIHLRFDIPQSSLPDVIKERLLACQQGAELSLCGIITPLAEINHGQPETVLRITAKVLLHGYVFQQQRGQGRLFSLMA